MSQTEGVNSFAGGLVSDLNAITTPNNVVTYCSNGTFITMNGNELVLQNDMGNTDLNDPISNPNNLSNGTKVQLTTNFIPLGVKEHGGIIYIVSSDGDKVEIGSFPGPQLIDPTPVTNTLNGVTHVVTATDITNLGVVYPLTTITIKPGDTFNILIPIVDSSPLTTYGVDGIRKFYKPRLINLDSKIDITDRFISSNSQWFKTSSGDPDIDLIYPYDLKSGRLGVKFLLEDIDYFKISNWVEGATESGNNFPKLEVVEGSTEKYVLNFNTFDILEGSSFKCNAIVLDYTTTHNLTNEIISNQITYAPTTSGGATISTENLLNTQYRLITKNFNISSVALTTTNLLSTSVTVNVDITSTPSSLTVVEKGVCWATYNNPLLGIASSQVNGSGFGDFSSNITGLTRVTTYYIRAYLKSSENDIFYSDVIPITTLAVLPTVSTYADYVNGDSWATGACNIIDDGGSNILTSGLCWSTAHLPTIVNSKIEFSGNPINPINLDSLNPLTDYYVRAYAINTIGITYGAEVTFTTTSMLPELAQSIITNILDTTAVAELVYIIDGGSAATERGFYYSTSNVDLTDNGFVTDPILYKKATIIDGEFNATLTGLIADTTYYVNSFVRAIWGITYSINIASFKTNYAIDIVELTIAERSVDLTTISCLANGNEFVNPYIIEKGFAYSTVEPIPTIENSAFEITGDDLTLQTFTALITTPDTVPLGDYYIRAYIKTPYDIQYSNVLRDDIA